MTNQETVDAQHLILKCEAKSPKIIIDEYLLAEKVVNPDNPT